MALTTIQKIPVTEVGPILDKVPFHRTLYVSEGTLTENIVFTPVVALGSSEELRPLPGAKVIYTLFGDGSSSPTFSGFSMGPESAEYDSTVSAANTITFEFDGFGFWANVSNISLVQPLDLVGDFGYGNDELVITGTDSVEISEFLYHSVPSSQITAFDILTSVHYVGTGILTYSVSKVDPITGPWASDTDPRYARQTGFLAGTYPVYVKVGDGLLESSPITCSVTITTLP